MLTKGQKKDQIEKGKKMLNESKFLVFVDFSGIGVEDLKKLRKSLLEIGAKVRVIKKKLLRIAFSESGFDFNPEQFDLQLATIFSQKDISDTAAPVYKFFNAVKEKGFKILGGYDLTAKNFLEAETVKRIGQLPPREVLLAQLLGVLQGPMKKFMYILDQKSKQTVEAK